jgi:Protein of Unknown function (DUF2784)
VVPARIAMSADLAAWLADAVLLLHVGVVLFVVGGLGLIVVGNLRGWRFVNRPGFRMLHLAAIAVVVAESWLDIACPLTTLEAALRARAGGPARAGSFIGALMQRLLYFDAPGWVFTMVYTLFGLAVAAAWWRYPPDRRR